MAKNKPSSDAGAENRRTRRKSASIDCALKIAGKVYAGRLLDISAEGAFVKTAHPLTGGDRLTVVFKARVDKASIILSLEAIVVYGGRFLQGFDNFTGFGMRFLYVSPDDAAALAKLVKSIESHPLKKYELLTVE
jgi:hypothetical protein